jgi:hypothetical protein
MPIAIFGAKSFSVSSNKIYTFDGFKLSGDIQTESQDLDGKKPSTYIKGPGLENISFTILLDSRFGINVRQEIDEWRAIRDAAVQQNFILGGKPVSQNKWLLKNVSVDAKNIDANGNITKAALELSFEEFVRLGSKQVAKSDSPGVSGSSNSDFSKLITEDKSGKRNNPNATYAVASGAAGRMLAMPD